MFYDRYAVLCKEKGISPSKAATEMGINKATVSVWKTKGTSPQIVQLEKIADYFDVSTDYLLGKTSQKNHSADDEVKDKELIVLARHMQKIPEKDRRRIMKNFQETIDVYLDAMGIAEDDNHDPFGE